MDTATPTFDLNNVDSLIAAMQPMQIPVNLDMPDLTAASGANARTSSARIRAGTARAITVRTTRDPHDRTEHTGYSAAAANQDRLPNELDGVSDFRSWEDLGDRHGFS